MEFSPRIFRWRTRNWRPENCRTACSGYRNKLYGLAISAERLQQIRNERRPNSKYAITRTGSIRIASSGSYLSADDIPFIDTTEYSIEEIASRILDRTGLERRLRP